MSRESLFDSRYRYDFIYPRGRSGEALRAYDTQQGDRQVVIKRPAPQDAPPIRAGQEANIRTERRALLQLAGHPVLTELLDEGTFRVGGQPHLFIVLEHAAGQIVEEMVLELAQQDEYMPELEMLVIVDNLIDLLAAAHKQDIVYNDVDAKHLFWDRASYQLKLIDWGNAVFLEGDPITPQGISRQSDVFQVGELLYFILTGGQRLSHNSENVDFGQNDGRIATRLKAIIQRAVHPALEQRYQAVEDLRSDLAEYRRPIERDRANVLDRIQRRLQTGRSQSELERLLKDVLAVQQQDPGYPPTRALRSEIEAELHRLAILADLEAAYIYLESANWPRAITLLEDVVGRASGEERARAVLLLEASRLVEESGLRPPPAGMMPAVEALAAGEPARAAQVLMVTAEKRDEGRLLQWLLAERIQVLNPDVVVLRPHLYRLSVDLDDLAGEFDVYEAQASVNWALAALDFTPAIPLASLKDTYQQVADRMRELSEGLRELDTAQGTNHLEAAVTSAAASARRACQTAAAVVAQLTTVAEQATAQPEASLGALLEAASLDPVNPAFAGIEQTLSGLHGIVEQLASYRPQADGVDLAEWFDNALADVRPYADLVPDPRLPMVISRLQQGRVAWEAFRHSAIAGSRQGALDGLQEAADAVRWLNPELGAWLTNVRGVVEKGRYVQRYALNAAFGQAMADGWTAWDRGSGIEAERLGKQALEEVRSDAEQVAADRLIRLGKLLRSWKESHGEGDPELTARLDAELLTYLTPEEDRYWQTFTDQMPSAAAYLKAMASGLVQYFAETSTAAQRILFFHYVLRGVIEMYEQRPEDADFWRAAAAQSLPDAERHIAFMALSNVIRDRIAITAIADQIESIQSIGDLGQVRRKVEASPLRLVLRPLVEMLRTVESALPQWERGEFRAVGQMLEAATAGLNEGERLGHIELPKFREWLERRYNVAAELSVTLQRLNEAVASPQEDPEPRLEEWHRRLVDETELFLNREYAGTFRAWHEAYKAVLAVYTDDTRRRSRKLHDLDERLNQRGVDLHPGYPLYRFWRQAVEARPEFPAPPTDEPVPRYTEAGEPLMPAAPLPIAEVEGRPLPRIPLRLRLLRGRPRWLLGLLAIALIVLIGLSALLGPNVDRPGVAVTWATFTATFSEDEAAVATQGAIETATAVEAGPTATATLSPTPSDTPTITPSPTETLIPTLHPGDVAAPTADFLLSTNTPLPTDIPTQGPPPTMTPVPITLTPTSDVPTVTPLPLPPAVTLAGPLRGRQNVLLALEQRAASYPWPAGAFSPGDLAGGWRLGVPELGIGEDVAHVLFDEGLLAQLFGADAAARLRRVEVTFSLREYEPELVPEGRVYFGLGLQGEDRSRVAVQVQLVRGDAINVGVRVGDEFRAQSTLPVNEVRVDLALVRYDDGTVDLLFEGQPIGTPRFLTAPNAPVMPLLFVQEGGVVVSVTNLIVELE